MPDRRTRQGKRDLALLHLLGSAGLRRSEAAALVLADVDERRRAADPRLRHAIRSSTSWWVTISLGPFPNPKTAANEPAIKRSQILAI